MIPDFLKIIWFAMLPIFELRLALPLAYFKYGFNIYESIGLSVLGNILPLLPILYFLNFVVKFFSKWNFTKKIFDWFFKRTEKAFSKTYAKWGKLGLVVFVGIPLPVTGAWTGAVASTLFKIKPKEAFWLLVLGVLLASFIVSTICLLFENLAMKWFL
jgi:uncharacterized membrane protein